ncbi:MAG: UDP-N-acetylmuramoyl-L-alanine--D-glutamate ligase [Candidatus Margulisbacteria bacterium]|nr:UDP-N-acetylmuramoyl-L-alanine--D-glutamate ligase [Candidatus Margulisiibacteriota bacterium]
MKVAVLGEGITGKAVKERLALESGYELVQPEEADLVVTSPGIPPKNFPKVKAPIISEIELAYQFLKDVKLIAVTGTNGKTTTTTLISKILDCPAAGNIGLPLISIKEKNLKYISVEVSSYQLEAIDKFKPFISVILNVTPDHLERHGSMEEYAQAKARIFMNQNQDDYVVFNANDLLLQKVVKNAKCNKVPIYPEKPLQQNILAVKAVAKICGVPLEKVEKILKEFKGVEHRLEEVAEFEGIKIINDSKATNPESTMVALDAIARPIILIAGGRDKNTPLEELANLMKVKIKHLILLGEAKDRFAKAFKNVTQSEVKDMEEAVDISFKKAKKGDVILLSPACASFDMFKNFEERGKVFKELVLKYIQKL